MIVVGKIPPGHSQAGYFTRKEEFTRDVKRFKYLKVCIRPSTLEKAIADASVLAFWFQCMYHKTRVHYSYVKIARVINANVNRAWTWQTYCSIWHTSSLHLALQYTCSKGEWPVERFCHFRHLAICTMALKIAHTCSKFLCLWCFQQLFILILLVVQKLLSLERERSVVDWYSRSRK